MSEAPDQHVDQVPGRARRRVVSLALVASMLGSAVGGGVLGSAATLYAVRTLPIGQTQSVSPTVEARAPAPAPEPARIADVRDDASIRDVFRTASPAVVSVSTGESRGPFGEFRQRGEGSGFVVDNSGLILTNHHVVEGATRLRVRFSDGTLASATLMGSDPLTDLAVLKVDLPPGQPVAVLGDSDRVEPGQTAVAIGSPFGLSQTVTSGIISAINRDWRTTSGGRTMRGLIQTDAPVNPGNSGGPLLNLAGEVIGITTAIESPIRGSVGIGFAIPINEAKRLLPQLARGERVEHPWLGISGMALTAERASQLGLSSEQGVVVCEVIPEGPAAEAGLRGDREACESDAATTGDVIIGADDRPVKSVQELSAYLDTRQVGDQVRLSVVRDGKEMELTVTLGAWPTGQRS